jgi:hypothetical protein
MTENFKSLFKATNDCQIAETSVVEKYSDKVPAYLIDIWQSTGFGKYRDGLIEIVNPEDFEPVLWTWLGKEVPNYVPFAISAFGELIYYRKLSETEEDICLIDIQYRKIEVLTWDLIEFFEELLLDEYEREEWLKEQLFDDALAKYGKLEKSEIFTLVPVLAFGGALEIDYLKKGNAQVYQHLVFSMTS